MTIKNAKSEDVIKEQYFKDYKKSLEIIWWELVRLNSTVFILNKLTDFPFKIFIPQGKDLFFNLVYHNFIENTIIIISRIFTDNSSDAHTIIWFKNKIRNEYLKEEYVNDFDEILKENRFSKRFNELSERIHKIRSNLVAHLKRDIVLSSVPSDLQISLKEVKEVVNEIEKLFKLICFNHEHHLYPIQWSPYLVRKSPLDKRPDIEEILDYFVLQSPILNLPEKNPYLWENLKSKYSEIELKKIDYYRKKFGLKSIFSDS
jgi:hypothetical protein